MKKPFDPVEGLITGTNNADCLSIRVQGEWIRVGAFQGEARKDAILLRVFIRDIVRDAIRRQKKGQPK